MIKDTIKKRPHGQIRRCSSFRTQRSASVSSLVLASFLLVFLSGCGIVKAPTVIVEPPPPPPPPAPPAETTVVVRCDARVNEGVLLTLDFVQANENEASQIRGREWFYSDLRNDLRLRTKTISVSGSCGESLLIVESGEEYDLLAIVADYQSDLSDSSDSSLHRYVARDWKGKTVTVSVHNTHIEVRGGG